MRGCISKVSILVGHRYFKYRYVVGVTTGCGHLADQQSSVESSPIKGSRGALRQDQAIKSQS